MSDSWADVEIHHDNEPWSENEKNLLYGNFAVLYRLKQANRNLKVLLSIGGWSYRENFKCLKDTKKRNEFVRSAVEWVEKLGLDG